MILMERLRCGTRACYGMSVRFISRFARLDEAQDRLNILASGK